MKQLEEKRQRSLVNTNAAESGLLGVQRLCPGDVAVEADHREAFDVMLEIKSQKFG